MIWGTDDLVRTSLFPGSWPLEWNTIFIIAVRINLWQPRYRECVRSSNWNGLRRGKDGGIRCDQISSILPAVCKQPLINNVVSVWRQMTPSSKNTPTLANPRGGGAARCERTHIHTHIWLYTERHKLTYTQTPFHQISINVIWRWSLFSVKGKLYFIIAWVFFVVLAMISGWLW